VNEVGERAGYTKGAVYSNFASKEDLFFAVYEHRVEQALTEVVPTLRQAGAERAFDWVATGTIERRDRDDGWLAVFFEFWAHVLRHPELRDRFAAIHGRFLASLQAPPIAVVLTLIRACDLARVIEVDPGASR
jgi:AcrR family transcriptional regulator